MGAFNYIGNVKSTVYRLNKFYWLQGGILNIAKSNGDGTQLGLINFGKDVGFSQLGLINISRNTPQYPVGLLNLSVTGTYFLRVYSNRRYWYNIEFASGSNKLLNGLSYSFGRTDAKRALGYHLGKIRYWGWNNYEYFEDFFVYAKLHHLSLKDLLNSEGSYGLKYERGYNPFILKKGIDLFLFAGLSCNLQHIKIESSVNDFMRWEMGKMRVWFDFNVGIQI